MQRLCQWTSENVRSRPWLLLATFALLAMLSTTAGQAQTSCEPDPCLNGGICQDDGRNDPFCRCPAGTSGDLCEIIAEPDVCAPNPCFNGGSCNDLGGGTFSCTCPAGTSGELCQVNVDPCDPDPCANGVCEDNGGGEFLCRCDLGFGGPLCDLEVDICDPNPCSNGGTCSDTGLGTFSCACPPGTSGETCDVIVTEDPCAPNPCQNDGSCDELDGGFVCRCPLGFEGELCELFGNACEVNQCQNEGTCVDNENGTFSCECAEGFEGELCETETDTTPPGLCNPNPCLNNGFCFEFGTQFFCSCVPPFSGTLCEIENILPQCAPNPCLNGGTCTDNNDNTFDCECPTGYDGDTCEIDTDLCDPDPCFNGGVCFVDGEDATCSCPEGFEGDFCQTVVAEVGLGTFLDEGAGTVTDFRGGFTGILQGSSAWILAQQLDGLELQGDGYVEVSDPGSASGLDITDAISISAWVLPFELGGHQMVLSKDDAYELEIGKLGESQWNVRFNNVVAAVANSTIQADVWQHLAVTWDGATVTLYYNGVADGSAAFTGPLDSNNANLGIGARPAPATAGGPTFFFSGGVDDVRLYDTALSAAEVADLFSTTVTDIAPPVRSQGMPASALASGTTSTTLGVDTDESASCAFDTVPGSRFDDMPSLFATTGGTSHSEMLSGLTDNSINRYFVRCRDGRGNTNSTDVDLSFVVGEVDLVSDLAAFWPLDEGSGCSALDLTGQHDGALGPDCVGGDAPAWSSGVNGSGLTFDGNLDEVAATTTASLQTPTALTLSAWIRHGTSYRFESIIDYRDAATDGYDLYTTDQSKLFMRVNNGALASSATVTDGAWHHVVGVYDGSQIRLYVDGLLDGSSTVGPQSIDVSAALLYLGRNFSANFLGFTGDIDEVMIYTRALSDIEVFETFLSGQP